PAGGPSSRVEEHEAAVWPAPPPPAGKPGRERGGHLRRRGRRPPQPEDRSVLDATRRAVRGGDARPEREAIRGRWLERGDRRDRLGRRRAEGQLRVRGVAPTGRPR